ncbi:MAG: TldD/PmbA family protein [Phycisphaerales bacterium]|nr:MAG: TldD/PmbA family protein [Phycisphaerales bacterium]
MTELQGRAWGFSVIVLVAAIMIFACPGAGMAAEEHPLLAVMRGELSLSMEKLEAPPDGVKPYFLQYTVTDMQSLGVSASLGAVTSEDDDHRRLLEVDLRVGDYALDSTRQIRGSYGGSYSWGGGTAALPLDGDPVATKQAIWLETDQRFKDAVKRLAQVKANLKVKVEEEDASDDFSREEPSVYVGEWVEFVHPGKEATGLVRRLSRKFRAYPLIYSSGVTLSGDVTNRLIVSSEGSNLQHGQGRWRVGIYASSVAEDGMELWQYTSFDAHFYDALPDEETMAAGVDKVIAEVMALREAPIVEPYTGPAILVNRASGVFFHEIFGHRIEGHRQKDVDEGQTFAQKLGEQILPEFLSVIDDPTQRTFGDEELNGYYRFDEECVPAQRAALVENGVLKRFLMSRTPARGITKSNGHGRRQPGTRVVSRMGNTIIESSKQLSIERLREMLIAECKRQDKEFGLLFADISGGFTMTRRWMPQAFKVMPILVYRVYVDGRPDELVRGVDIVGTPLTCFSMIMATGDDPGVFNGMCGAESGAVPVSAVSPSILVEKIEVEKKQKAQDRPPILEAPIASEAEGKDEA